MAVHRFVFRAGSDGRWARVASTRSRKPRAPRPKLKDEVDYSVAGLGAYRAYRSHPGKHFPSRALTLNTERDYKAPTRSNSRSARVVTKL